MTRTSGHHGDEIRSHFEAELEEIRRGAVQLGALVLENTKRLAEALIDNRLDLARQVIEADDEIDQRYSDLERRAFQSIALQQPVAGDLRFLVSITRMLYEIERSGDLAVNSARGLLREEGYHLSASVQGVLGRLCRASADMMAKAIDALAEMDAGAGLRLDQEDDVVDALVSEFYTLIAAESADLGVQTAIELSRAGRYLERIADHAVNIGDHITFIVTGSFPRHADTMEDGAGA